MSSLRWKPPFLTIQLDYVLSAMTGIVLTSTGEILATPTPAELVNAHIIISRLRSLSTI